MSDWIDLHTHSLASDGSDSPAALVQKAAALGLRAVAITDHDSFDGLSEAAEAAARCGVELVPGAELSTGWEGLNVHLLAYYADVSTHALRAVLARAEALRAARNEELLERLRAAGYPVSSEALRAAFPGQTMLGRPHVAEYLMRLGYVSSVTEGIRSLMGPGAPFYVPRRNVPLAEAIAAVRAAGGVPVLAHPFQYRCAEEKRLRLLDAATEAGLLGLEARYSDHSPEQEATALRWAAERGLLTTGGSDYHGARKPHIALGAGRGGLRVPYALLAPLKAAAGRVQSQ